MRKLAILLVAAATSLGAGADAGGRVSRTISTEASTCDGSADYADELRPFKHRLFRKTIVGPGLTEVAIAIDLRKRVPVPFRAARALPDLATLAPDGVHGDLGVQVASLLPAEFPAIGASAKRSSSSAPLVLRLPTLNVAELRRRLMTRQLPLIVHADEQRVLQPGVRIERWPDAVVPAFQRRRDIRAVGNWATLDTRARYDHATASVIALPSGLDTTAIGYLQESIPGIYVSGSFCTPPPDRDARVVRKPTLEIRVRPGGTRVTTDIDSRLRADAGAGVGRKRLDVGYAVGHDQRLGENGWFFEVRRAGHHPVRFTLPQLTDDTELSRGADAVHD